MPGQKHLPKVLIIDNSMGITGALNAILGYAEYAKEYFQFVFILPNNSRAVTILSDKGYEVLTLPFVELSKSWRNMLLYIPYLLLNAFRLKSIIANFEIESVHVNDFYNLTAVVAKIWGSRVPIITHVRFMPDRFPSPLVKLWIRINIRYAETIICVSQAVKHCLPDHPKIQVIYDCLYPPVSIDDLPNKHEEEGTINLLYLSNYIRGKGQDVALEAFALAVAANNKLRLKFVGGDMGLEKNQQFKQSLIQRASDLNVQPYITFDGSTQQVYQEIQQADIVLNFSESESFSMTCLEALTMGKPLIATNSGGPAELFEDGVSGILIAPGDIEKIFEAILLLSLRSDLRENFSKAGSSFVRNKFNVKGTFEKLLKIYDFILLKR